MVRQRGQEIPALDQGATLRRAQFLVPRGVGKVNFTSFAEGKLMVGPGFSSVAHGPMSVAEVSTT
jgi:hypothetical protein